MGQFVLGLALWLAALPATLAASPYTDLFIVRPQDREVLRSSTGDVSVQVALDPVLQVQSDHRFRALVDGQLWPVAWVRPEFTLKGVDRGAHTLQVIVTDAQGTPLATSAPVQFQLHRPSRLQPKPKGP